MFQKIFQAGQSTQVLMISSRLFRAALNGKWQHFAVLNQTIICLPTDKATDALFKEFIPQGHLASDTFSYIQILNTLA